MYFMNPAGRNYIYIYAFSRHFLAYYRPISNLTFLSKILEKVVSSQLFSFLEKNYICEDF